MNKNDPWDLILIVFICLFTVVFAYAVIETASGYQPYKVRQATYRTRPIPECNKELWLRVKDGCDE
jgi:hypothetical protein